MTFFSFVNVSWIIEPKLDEVDTIDNANVRPSSIRRPSSRGSRASRRSNKSKVSVEEPKEAGTCYNFVFIEIAVNHDISMRKRSESELSHFIHD